MTASGCTCTRAERAWRSNHTCARCGQNVLEKQLVPVLLQILCGGTGLTLWPNPRGYDAQRKVKYGLAPGAADYIGLYQTGRFVGVEFKTERGRQQENQRAFEALITRLNGVYAVVRSETDANELLAVLGSSTP